MAGSPTPANSLTRRVLELERELVTLRNSLLTQKEARSSFPRNIRLAVTHDNDDDYPEDGGSGHLKVPIKFIDATFAPTQGWSSLTTQPRVDASDPGQVIAANVAEGAYFPAGTIVSVFWQRAITSVATNDTDGEWWIISSAASSGGAEIIEFTIVSVDDNVSPHTAVVSIESRPCGSTAVTGETNGQVTVVDPSGCFLDELPADLVGRWGGATYQLPDGEEDCQWRFIWLCCKPCEPEAQSTQSSASESQAMITGLGPGPIPGQYLP